MHRNITKFTLLALLWVICTGPSSAQSLEGVLTDDVAYTRQKFSFPPSLGKPRGVLITVRINDSPREFSFLLDTGANATTITKATADALKLPVKKLPPNTPFAQGEAGKLLLGLAHLETIQFGDLLWESDVAVIKDDFIRDSPATGKIDGILGMNLLYHYTIQIDSKKQTVLFLQGKHSGEAVRASLGFKDAVEVTLGKRGSMREVATKLDGKHDFSLLLDTGALFTILSERALLERNVRLAKGEPAATSSSIRGLNDLYQGQGVLRLADSPTTDYRGWYFGKTGPDLDGKLGMDVLSQFNVLIDFPSGRMFLAAP